jgi:hypothetical protein
MLLSSETCDCAIVQLCDCHLKVLLYSEVMPAVVKGPRSHAIVGKGHRQ